MLYHLLYPLHDIFGGFNVFRYITFRSIGATITAFLLVLVVAPAFIRFLKEKQIGQVIRANGPESHHSKKGVPTMGGVLILFAVTFSTLLWVDLTSHFIWIIVGVTLWYGAIGAWDDSRKLRKKDSKGLSAWGKILFHKYY